MSLRSDLEALNNDYWQNNLIKIKSLDTLKELIYVCNDCKLSIEQIDNVSPLWYSIGKAYLFKDDNYPCVIYNESEPIGFICFYKWIGSENTYSWSYFIDLKYQGKGYGKKAAQLAIEILRKANPNISIKLAAEKTNTKAHNLYYSLGFSKSDEMDGDDIVFLLNNNKE